MTANCLCILLIDICRLCGSWPIVSRIHRRQILHGFRVSSFDRSRINLAETTCVECAVLWTPSNDTSRLICSDSLNLMPPVPLYLRTLWRYTNAVIIIIIIETWLSDISMGYCKILLIMQSTF